MKEIKNDEWLKAWALVAENIALVLLSRAILGSLC